MQPPNEAIHRHHVKMPKFNFCIFYCFVVIDSFLCNHLKVLTYKKVNASIEEKNRIENQCIKQINQTVDECIVCMNNCGSQITVPVQNMQRYEPFMFYLVTLKHTLWDRHFFIKKFILRSESAQIISNSG